ncbi:unnamed protein product [Adineta steineri]|uniref:Uncharacterized protein n=1 Tax=Adineta steineri TaxID=433720 RepID=A0A814KN10_9BILA|nr:unnamed protein product [Adineta steineri]
MEITTAATTKIAAATTTEIAAAATIEIAATTTTKTTTTITTNTIISKSNLLINGDAETGPCELGKNVTHPTGWMYDGPITQVRYNNTAADQFFTSPGPSDRGNCYFYGHISAVTSMWQYINMTNSIDPILIDNQRVYFNFSAWIGGYAFHNDNAQVSLAFIDQANQNINSNITLGPVSAGDRGSVTSLLFRQANGLVPIGARSCKEKIHNILQTDVGNGDINQSSLYKDLLKNIKYHDVCFNFGIKYPQKTGECNVDVIVGRYLKEDNSTIYTVANVTVGVISIDIKTNKRQFMVNLSATQDNHSKSEYLS